MSKWVLVLLVLSLAACGEEDFRERSIEARLLAATDDLEETMRMHERMQAVAHFRAVRAEAQLMACQNEAVRCDLSAGADGWWACWPDPRPDAGHVFGLIFRACGDERPDPERGFDGSDGRACLDLSMGELLLDPGLVDPIRLKVRIGDAT